MEEEETSNLLEIEIKGIVKNCFPISVARVRCKQRVSKGQRHVGLIRGEGYLLQVLTSVLLLQVHVSRFLPGRPVPGPLFSVYTSEMRVASPTTALGFCSLR